MAAASSTRPARAAVLVDARAKIERYGWAVIGVCPHRLEEGVSFAYTVGLSEWWAPELAVYGLDLKTWHCLLNAAARWITRLSAQGPSSRAIHAA